eukprot:1914195-Rhodomonas_salina.1
MQDDGVGKDGNANLQQVALPSDGEVARCQGRDGALQGADHEGCAATAGFWFGHCTGEMEGGAHPTDQSSMHRHADAAARHRRGLAPLGGG